MNMTVGELIKALQEAVANNPKIADYPVAMEVDGAYGDACNFTYSHLVGWAYISDRV